MRQSSDEINGVIHRNYLFQLQQDQSKSWIEQIEILKKILIGFEGLIIFEFSIPRMGNRVDVILIIRNVVFVLEFKVGENKFHNSDIEQVWDYALDLKNFHETSQNHFIAPILIATDAKQTDNTISLTKHEDMVLIPVKSNSANLLLTISQILEFADGNFIDFNNWSDGKYSPTPSIIEAAMSLYNSHSVIEITRSDATAINLASTSNSISDIIELSKNNSVKSICFVTGVPGAGKTLVGLDVATKHMDKEERTTSVYLSGNGPLVAILREALTRDKLKREKAKGNKLRKGEVFSEVKLIIQNVHNFRDECINNESNPPFDHVAMFDEAQRAWTKDKTTDFMKRRKGIPNFNISEPEFLISCLDRHTDWAVIVCLVGGGQEIHTGEAGISEWIKSLNHSFENWHIYVSDKLTDSEYAAGEALNLLQEHKNVEYKSDLHLAVSLRSFRAENQSLLVKNLLDLDVVETQKNFNLLKNK